MQNIEMIKIGVPKHVLTMQSIHHDIMMMKNIHHDQLKQFHVKQQEDMTAAR